MVPTAPGQRVVLIVDDFEDLRKTLGLALRHFGFDTLLAAGGREALELFRRHGPEIDLVLMDVQMPDGNGPETLDALRCLDPGVRCCFLTGDPGRYTADDLFRRGALRVLSKPIDLADLVRVIRQILGPTSPSKAA